MWVGKIVFSSTIKFEASPFRLNFIFLIDDYDLYIQAIAKIFIGCFEMKENVKRRYLSEPRLYAKYDCSLH
jgi:hypothetical protein